MKLDTDLQSIQEVRDHLHRAKQAQKTVEHMTQEQIDAIVRSMAEAAERESVRLASMAVDETGFGRVTDKTVKNLFAARDVYGAIRDMKTVGILNKDDTRKVWDIAQPVGVVAGIVPSTNPTSTVIFKSLIAVKARNAIVFSPHPSALRCSVEAVRIVQEAAERAGAPAGLIQSITTPTMAATDELMKHRLTNVILATGGSAMVKAAYSSGKPAYGVGPGNVPVYIHASAKIEQAVKRIITSKTFDYGTICASEQAIVVDESVKKRVLDEFVRQGAYVMNDEEKRKVGAVIMIGKGLNPKIVGRSPQVIADMAGISIPAGTTVLIGEESQVGKDYPLSVEKLCPILALYTVKDWREGCETSIKLLELGGLGHTLGMHCEDTGIIEAFGLEKPASRIVVNSGTTFGGIGASTGIMPSLTLGCGSFGNNITSDNIGPQHLLNIKRVAFGIRELEPAQIASTAPSGEAIAAAAAAAVQERSAHRAESGEQPLIGITRDEVMDIVKSVISQLKLS